MSNLVINLEDHNGIKTMSSLEMTSYINLTRKPIKRSGLPQKLLRHDNFTVKVKKVLGNSHIDFLGTSYYKANNCMISRPTYYFPRHQAILMALSYSYDLQIAVLEAWEKHEKDQLKLDKENYE